jgi:hypothetical protein
MDDGRQAAIKKFDASENEPNDEFLKQVNIFASFLVSLILPFLMFLGKHLCLLLLMH